MAAKGKAKGAGSRSGKDKGKGTGKAPEQKLPKGQRPGLVDRLAVVVGVAFAGSLAWQHLPL